MAGLGRNDSKKLTSLLLQPPNSSFSWNDVPSGNILMPVTQMEPGTEDYADADTFLGQEPNKAQQFPTAPEKASVAESSPSGSFSQLQQPLRPPPAQMQASPLTQFVGSPVAPTENLSAVPEASFQASQPLQDQTSPALAPPPMGPPMNFHRQSPLTHASFLRQTAHSSHTIASGPGIVATSPIGQSQGALSHQGPGQNGPPPQNFYAPSLSQTSAFSHDPSFSASPPASFEQPLHSYVPDHAQIPVSPPGATYVPVRPHWFYNKEIENKIVWIPFSLLDSTNLEEASARLAFGSEIVVTTDGGRYDVDVGARLRRPVYWDETPSQVRRCTWFYKLEGQNRFVPYEEHVAFILEDHYRKAMATGSWHQKLELPGNQTVVMHNSSVMVHFLPSSHPDEWGNVSEGQTRPRVVKRGIEDVETIEEGEPSQIDHLVFVVHGVGSVCDFRFRSVEECLDDIRHISLGLIKSHFSVPSQEGNIGRIEFLPVSWHSTLHSDATGIDSALKHITLRSIPKLRHFTNDTLLDILFYTSPVYCQTIVDTVGSEINRLYSKFTERNPSFKGTVALAGHSLGSLILYDILSHQGDTSSQSSSTDVFVDSPKAEITPPPTSTHASEEASELLQNADKDVSVESVFQELMLGDYISKIHEEKIDIETLKMCSEGDLREMGLPMGPRKKLLSYMKELSEKQSQHKAPPTQPAKAAPHQQVPLSPQASVSPQVGRKRESVASVNYSMGMAGTGQLSVSYPKINFHPSCFFALGSPIAMFLVVRGNETLCEDFRLPTCPAFFNIFHPFDPVAYRMETLIDPNFTACPVLIPHHKGRKRMHLELKESLSRMGSDLKQRFMDSLRYTWNSLNEFARAHRSSPAQMEAEVDRVLQEEIIRQADAAEVESTVTVSDLQGIEDIGVGQLNGGRRIDYVLQEKPIESFNEYLFALASHACYWESEDTVLLILKELYALQGFAPQLATGRSASQPKVQLYNPAAPLGNTSVVVPPPPMPLLSPSKETYVAPSGVPPLPLDGPSAPPPLQGFVRVSPLTRK
ncbi:triacylglycerol hydrolase DDHD2 isoform X1 [Dermacentor andersoni]|uniref:triacylglycerol hydrolase DDHD2 isoform X1 n=1 Tax=Dermacentor andersoni TaxID=34620 RepID=UPI003B3A5318